MKNIFFFSWPYIEHEKYPNYNALNNKQRARSDSMI
jgi:hypothetical protein